MTSTLCPAPAVKSGAVMYQLFLRMFTPEGTLEAASALLPHLASIGVDIVYLCQVAEADGDMRREFWSDRQVKSGLGNPKNPYRIRDYFAVDPDYGTDEDLARFIRRAHALKMRVILDLVYLHCGPGAVFLTDHPDFVKRAADGAISVGEWHFPLLDYDNPALREYLWKNMEYYIRRFDADGYRCDVGDGCPLDFWEEGRARIEAIKPDVLMLNEGMRPEYLKKAFDLNYNFKWYETLYRVLRGQAPASEIRSCWEETGKDVPGIGRYARMLDNHDIANDQGDRRAEREFGPDAVEAAFAINYLIDGVPFIYNGCEVCDASRHSIYSDGRHGAMRVDWSGALTRRGTERAALLRRLADLRHAREEIARGRVVWLETDRPDQAVAFARVSGDHITLAAMNLCAKPLTMKITLDPSCAAFGNAEPCEILLRRGAAHESEKGGLDVDLMPWGILALGL